jgi:hypothetical protein
MASLKEAEANAPAQRNARSLPRLRVSFTPRWTGKFKIHIRNLGRVYNRYVLVNN